MIRHIRLKDHVRRTSCTSFHLAEALFDIRFAYSSSHCLWLSCAYYSIFFRQMSSGKIVCEIYLRCGISCGAVSAAAYGCSWNTLIKKQTCCGKPASVLPGPKGHGGDEEDWTLDLTDANRTLSQLSYVPMKISPWKGQINYSTWFNFCQSHMIYTVDVAPAFSTRTSAVLLPHGCRGADGAVRWWLGKALTSQSRWELFQLVERFSIPKDVFGEVVDTVFFLVRCVMIDKLHEIFKRFFCPAVFLYAHPPPLLAGMVHKSWKW